MKTLLTLILSLVWQMLFCQTNKYISNEFDFIGYENSEPIYQFIQLETNSTKNYTLFKSNIDNSGIVSFEFYKESQNRIVYLNDNLYITLLYNSENYIIKININPDYTLSSSYNSIGYERKNLNFIYAQSHNLIIFPFIQKQKTGLDQLAYTYSDQSSKTIILPLIGNHFFIDKKEEYLYLSSEMICDNFSTMPLNVYRVKIGDWNNPELILEEVNSWFLIPDKDIIYARIHLGKAEHNKRILYNINTKTYAKIDNKHSHRAIKYKGKYYYESRERNQPIKYLPIDIPKEFPYKDERIICGKNNENIISNLPNSQKLFTKTFITEELLYEADTVELKSHTKDELRKLRNSFYARQGYQFSSKDLQDFFGQFDWYHKMVKRNKYLEISNDQVVISPEDKKRIELITEIEQQKK